jgi:polyisoprenoid-binding protein YceI
MRCQPDVPVRKQICKEDKKMSKRTAVLAVAASVVLGVLALGAKKPASTAGVWEVDGRHSDAQIITDGTTDYGKTKINVTLGFARVHGALKIDDADPTQSRVDLHIYPATASSMMEPIEEEGAFRSHWLANQANNTIVCFHSKKVARTADGRLQATGELSVTRVDRNVEVPAPSEAYYGPIYGPPIIHRTAREATLVFDLPADGNAQKDGAIEASASTKVFREDFPQLVRTVLSTSWPPVVLDENCTVPAPSEAYSGARCTGTFMQSPKELASIGFPAGPVNAGAADYPGPQDFNAVVGQRVDIAVHLRLTAGAGGHMAAGN